MAQGAFSAAKRGRRGKRTMRSGAALLTAAVWMLFMLTSCAEGEPRPTVQKDDLSPQPDAQERLELAAGNGKNYACHWDAQDIEAALAQLQAEEEQHIEARLAELEQLTPAQLAERGRGSVDQARKFLQEEAARTLAFARLYLQEEAAREPVFTAQEAANRAGALFEELCGADFSNEVLEMHCEEREGYSFARPEPLRTVQLVWEARPLIDHLDQSRDWSAFNDFSCTLDADTGEILSIWHHRSEREYEEWMCGPLPECWREDPKTGIRRWDTGDPAFETLVERAGARLSRPVLSDQWAGRVSPDLPGRRTANSAARHSDHKYYGRVSGIGCPSGPNQFCYGGGME